VSRPETAKTDLILRRLVRRQDVQGIRKLLKGARPEDIAVAMQVLTWSEQRRLYGLIDDPTVAADVLASLSSDSVLAVTQEMTEEYMAELLDRMEADDATDVLGALPEDQRERVLAELVEDGDEDVAELLNYPPDSAGGIMSPDFFQISLEATCGQAIREIQQVSDELPSVHYAYVVGPNERLVGVVSLRQLVVNPSYARLASIMVEDPIVVHPQDDQEEVARFVARYDLLSVPVVDRAHRILGIVTVDDVVDVIRAEAAEDMLRMVGISEDGDLSPARSLWRQARTRGGWLVTTLVVGLFMSEIIGSFESALEKEAVLAGFIPVIMGMAGNVGIQGATIAVRGLSTGQLQPVDFVRFIYTELRVGLVLGVAFGIMLTTWAALRYGSNPMIGVALGTSIVLAIGAAGMIGALIPVVFSRFNVDPALAAGPVVTSVVDVLGVVIYFNVAMLALGL